MLYALWDEFKSTIQRRGIKSPADCQKESITHTCMHTRTHAPVHMHMLRIPKLNDL